MGGVEADGFAFAQVGHGESDGSFGECGGGVVAFFAAAGDGSGAVEAALSGALAAAVGADEANLVAEVSPSWGVVTRWHGHEVGTP